MMMPTIDEAKETLQHAEAEYRAVEVHVAGTRLDNPTARQVLEQAESQAALEGEAQNLVDAREVYQSLEAQRLGEVRQKAEVALVAVEADLVVAIEAAENNVRALESSLSRVRKLSKKRYALVHDATGKANHRLLAKEAMAGWLKHRLASLELSDLGRADRHHRRSLVEILGLTASVPTENQEEDK